MLGTLIATFRGEGRKAEMRMRVANYIERHPDSPISKTLDEPDKAITELGDLRPFMYSMTDDAPVDCIIETYAVRYSKNGPVTAWFEDLVLVDDGFGFAQKTIAWSGQLRLRCGIPVPASRIARRCDFDK